jgi:AraC-like DNA-binding protein
VLESERLRDRLRNDLESETETQPDDDTSEPADIETEARPIIREHLPDPDFGVDVLAEKMAMSRSGLYRAFDEHTDHTPSDLITELRMEKAAELLEDGEGSVTQVAYAVGYERLSSFSRAFRKHAGHSPSAVTTGN